MDDEDILDLDAEGEDDTFLGASGDLESTRNLAAQARRDTGMMQRSPSPAGSASSLEGLDMEPRRVAKKRKISKEKGIASQTIAKITLNAVKETMRMCAKEKNLGRRRKAADSDSESEDDQLPIMIEETFLVKDNGHDILDFKIRNSLRTINAKPEKYYKHLNKKVEPQLESLEVDHITANTVNPKIVKKVHDRSAHLELKYFDAGNITVESRAPKASFSARGGDIQGDLALDWIEPDTVWQCVDALFNYCTTVYSVRRDDYTPWVIMKVLHEIRYFSVCKDARTQKKVLTEFVNCIFRKNESNARKKAPPVDNSDALKLAENELKKAGQGGNYYGVEPYSGVSAMDKKDMDELVKLRARVAQQQQELDAYRRRPEGPPKLSYGGNKPRDKPWNQMTGTEKQAITCRDW